MTKEEAKIVFEAGYNCGYERSPYEKPPFEHPNFEDWWTEQSHKLPVMQGLAELSDEVLAEAFAILFDKEWKRYWPVKSKADEIRSIIKANDQPCRPFENWVRCIDFLRTQASPAVGQRSVATVAEGWVATPKPKVPNEIRQEKLRKKLNVRKSSEGQP